MSLLKKIYEAIPMKKSFYLNDRARIIRVTNPPFFHFFGYYDKTPWSIDSKYMLCLESKFMDRPPSPSDKAGICLLDVKRGFYLEKISETYAWNWQQGCMFQWMLNSKNKIIYNVRKDGFVSVIHDIESDEKYYLPLPIYAISPNGRYALSLNFARLNNTRPGYGYTGIKDPWYNYKAPIDDGIYLLDIENGTYELILSLYELSLVDPLPVFGEAKHWVNHIQFNTRGDRFVFLHRWARPNSRFVTRMFTSDINGSGLHLLVNSGLVSHFDWKDERNILVWCRISGKGEHFFLIDDFSGEATIVGEEVLTSDGHCSFSPDRRWILTDTYPDNEGYRKLMIYNVDSDELVFLGKFYSLPQLKGEIRCDLHPRWSRDGKKICIDSTHEGDRQMYVIDVSKIV